MILKRYIVSDMQEGMEKIKKELGSEAVILSSKQIKKKGIKGLFSKPKLEVVAAYDDKEISIQKSDISPISARRRATVKTAANAYKPSEPTPAAVSELESKITNIDNMLNTFLKRFDNNYNDKFANYSKNVRAFASGLLENEVKEDIVYRLCDEVCAEVKNADIEEKAAIEKTVRNYLGEKSPVALKSGAPTVIMFIGTTGVGKTTTLSKMATLFAMQQGKDIAIITTDTYKIASSEQLKIYSEILEVPLFVAHSNADIPQQMERFKDKDIIFIDTGKCPDEQMYKNQITELIQMTSPDEIYLVVSASTNYRFCSKTLSDYSYVDDYKFIITKTDEAMSLGTLFNLRSLSPKKIAYLTCGQILTEDIDEYSADYVLEKLFSEKQ